MFKNNCSAEQQNLMKRIQFYGFAVTEATLFLDTHPTDKAALKYHNKYTQLRNEAMDEYQQKFGPLTLGNYQSDDKWEWVSDPWPWEMEA